MYGKRFAINSSTCISIFHFDQSKSDAVRMTLVGYKAPKSCIQMSLTLAFHHIIVSLGPYCVLESRPIDHRPVYLYVTYV